MTWTAVALLQNDSSIASPPSLTPLAVGDLVWASVNNNVNATSLATALSSANITWTFVGNHAMTAGSAQGQALFVGRVTSTAAATPSVTWSGTAPATQQWYVEEFRSTAGAWFVQASGFVDSAGATTMASLTPATNGELYVGWCGDSGTAGAGSTPGYVYTGTPTANGNAFTYNLACTPAAQAPNIVSTGGNLTNGGMTLIQELAAPFQMPQRQRNRKWQVLQRPTPSTAVAAVVAAPAQLPVFPRRRLARAVCRGGAGQGFVAVPAPRQLPPLPRRRPARGVWRGGAGAGFVRVPAPPQLPVFPRRRPGRAVWRGGAGQGFAAVPAPLQGPYRPPRRTPGRVVWRGGAGQGFVQVPAPPQLPPVPRRRPGRVLWAGNAVPPVTFVFVAVPAPAQQFAVPPRRRPARGVYGGIPVPPVSLTALAEVVWRARPAPRRAVIYFTPVAGTNASGAPVAVPAPRLLAVYPRRRLQRAYVRFIPVRTVNAPPGVAAGPVQGPYRPPRRKPVRAVVQFTPVFTVNAPGIGCINKQIAADAPAAWWRLADAPGSPAAADSGISHAYPGTPAAVTFGLPGPDPIPGSGTAASLNGTTSRVLSTYNPVLPAVTVEAWVNLNGLHQATSFGRLVSDSFTQSDNHGFELLLNAGSVTFAVGSGAAFSLISGGTIPPSGWTQVVGTWDGTTISLYVNGSLVGSAPFAGSLSAGTASGVSIGYNSTYNGDFVGGLMAEVAIYPAALSPARVAARYACVVPPVPSGVITGGQSAGGDRDPWIREFRSIMPGEIPELGGQLPRLHGRGYAAPAPSRAEDVEVLWEAPPEPAVDPGPSIAEIVSDSARNVGTGLYGLGRILAPEPYVPPSRVKCGALRKIGAETLRCSRKRGHPGLHSDRGVKWG
jgi:hypothetical protein